MGTSMDKRKNTIQQTISHPEQPKSAQDFLGSSQGLSIEEAAKAADFLAVLLSIIKREYRINQTNLTCLC